MTDTLKSICEQCTHLNNPQLDFIPEDLQRYREILRRDVAELVQAASYGLQKSVVAVAGSLLEGLLYSYLKPRESLIVVYRADRNKPFKVDPGESLQSYLNIFKRYFGSNFPSDMLPPEVARLRDLIHINREISSDPEFCRKAAPDLLLIVDAVLGQFAKTTG
jgi:hypothetical protein